MKDAPDRTDPLLDYTGRNIIITGAGRGIGRAHALLLASRGANIVVADLGTTVLGELDTDNPAEAVVAEIKSAGGSAVACLADISTKDGAEAVVASAVEAFGGVDVVINNAGIVHNVPFEELTVEGMQRHLDVHYYGSFHMATAAWEYLKKSGTGRIVNTISPAMLGVGNMLQYGSSKGAVFGLTMNLAVEGGPYGITVNALAPGAATRMLEASADSFPEEVIAWMRTAVLPEQVAPTAAYLAHSSTQEVTGQVFFVAGGNVSRLAMVKTPGFSDPAHTIEQVAENIGQVLNLEGAELQGITPL